MLNMFDRIYWDSEIPEKKHNQIKWRLKVLKIRPPFYYVITFANGNDQLEIYNSAVLIQPYYKNSQLTVVGIAKSYDRALVLIQDMIEESIFHTGSANVKDYLISKD